MSEDMLREVAAAQRREFGDVRPRCSQQIMSAATRMYCAGRKLDVRRFGHLRRQRPREYGFAGFALWSAETGTGALPCTLSAS